MKPTTRLSSARLLNALAYQRILLADTRRNRAFHRALALRVRPGCSLLDLGAGSGLWAVAAARLGARHAVAVEREPELRPVIEALARENGVGSRVEVVIGDARTLELDRRFDVVVSETVGNEGLEEGLLRILARARRLFLKRGGALVPERLALLAAPVAWPRSALAQPPFLAAASFASLASHVPLATDASRLRRLAPPRVLCELDLRTADPEEPLPVARLGFRLADARDVGGVAVWVRLGLAPQVTLDTATGTHWLASVLPVEPLPAGPGRLELEIDWNPRCRRWSSWFEGPRGRAAAAHQAPAFAWGAVRAALGRAPRASALTPVRRRD